MTEDEILRLWIVLGGIGLIFLFVGAWLNKFVVYRDFCDLGYSLILVLSPIVGLALIWFISSKDTTISSFATENLVGNIIIIITTLVMIWAIIKTYTISIYDNGVVLGFVIGSSKIVVAILITLFSIGLYSYLFKDKRRAGHVFIFFLLFGVFSWFIKTLVNGDSVLSKELEK